VADKKAVILLSGGLDSATTLAIARDEDFECYALTFRYGQRHKREIEAAKKIADSGATAEHRIIDIDLAQFGSSALTDSTIEVPKDRGDLDSHAQIPTTYVPARNTIFLSYALAWAEVLGAFDIFIGVNATDYSGYPDCRSVYFDAYRRLIDLGTRPETHIRLLTPFLHLGKADIVRRGLELGAPLHLSWSCYEREDQACGLCESCRLRLSAFRQAGVPDPIPYVAQRGGKGE